MLMLHMHACRKYREGNTYQGKKVVIRQEHILSSACYRLMITKILYTLMNNTCYRRSTIFHCHLIFVGRGKSEKKKKKHMKVYNTILNGGTIMNFLDQNLKIKKWWTIKTQKYHQWKFVDLQYTILQLLFPFGTHSRPFFLYASESEEHSF